MRCQYCYNTANQVATCVMGIQVSPCCIVCAEGPTYSRGRPRGNLGARRSQETRRSQEEPGGARRSQEESVGASRSQEEPGGARGSQRSQEKPGESQEGPGGARRSQEEPGEPGGRQEEPTGARRSHKILALRISWPRVLTLRIFIAENSDTQNFYRRTF